MCVTNSMYILLPTFLVAKNKEYAVSRIDINSLISVHWKNKSNSTFKIESKQYNLNN